MAFAWRSQNYFVRRLSICNQFLVIRSTAVRLTMSNPSSDLASFREALSKAKHVVALTGAGISAESGIPTFRGAGGLWRKYAAPELATPGAFHKSPALVWEFYSYRRELVLTKQPNPAHYALADLEKRFKNEGKKLTVITQNIDELHRRAGTEKLIELHGTLFKTLCTKCKDVAINHDSPICPAMADKGDPDPKTMDSDIPLEDLPRCKKGKCKGLLRPYVVWFGESLDPAVLRETKRELDACDLCLIVGTSSIVYPAAMFAPQVAERGVPVAEFNLEATPESENFGFHFEGPCGETLPKAILP